MPGQGRGAGATASNRSDLSQALLSKETDFKGLSHNVK
jgi:hypothetical protein